jgi:hypothetical protein
LFRVDIKLNELFLKNIVRTKSEQQKYDRLENTAAWAAWAYSCREAKSRIGGNSGFKYRHELLGNNTSNFQAIYFEM